MARKPQAPKTNSSIDVLNAIRNSATINYQNYVPLVTGTEKERIDSIRKIGAIFFDHPELKDEFTGLLINRVALVRIVYRNFYNKMNIFKKGFLEYGETVEEIFQELAKPFQFDPNVAESEMWKRQLPETKVAYHLMNYKKFYKLSLTEAELNTAFTGIDGVNNFLAGYIEKIFQAHEYDEYQVMKYLLAIHILNGRVTPVQVPMVSTATLGDVVSTIKSVSNDFEFRNPNYNFAKVRNVTPKSEQYILVDTKLDAKMTTELLAFMFNMEVGDVQARRMTIDGFGNLDKERLSELFDGDEWYTELTDVELNSLKQIPAVLMDTDWFMVYDNLARMKDAENGEGLYRQHWYHTWKTFSVSPFAQIACFVTNTPIVDSVEITPATITLAKGKSTSFTVEVETENFAPKTVNWSITGSTNEKTTISADGRLTIASDETATTITVKATSTFDANISDTAVVTVS